VREEKRLWIALTVTVDAQRRRIYDPATCAVFTICSNRDGSGDFVQKFCP
jgi:hypothetical protein